MPSKITAILPKQVLIADDHPMFRDALRILLTKNLGVANVVEVDSFASLQRHFKTTAATDFVLLDLDMPGVSGFSSLSYLCSEHPRLPVVVVSGRQESDVVQRALKLGAHAYIPKNLPMQELADVLRLVIGGQRWSPVVAAPQTDKPPSRIDQLTPTQYRVLMLLAAGRLNKQIGSELRMTESTVKWHVTAILRQLGVRRRTEAAIVAQRLLYLPDVSRFVAGD